MKYKVDQPNHNHVDDTETEKAGTLRSDQVGRGALSASGETSWPSPQEYPAVVIPVVGGNERWGPRESRPLG